MDTQRDFVINLLENMLQRVKIDEYLEVEDVRALVGICNKMKKGKFEDEINYDKNLLNILKDINYKLSLCRG